MIEAYAEYGALGIIVLLFESSDRRHEALIKEINDISDDMNYLKGKSNGRS